MKCFIKSLSAVVATLYSELPFAYRNQQFRKVFDFLATRSECSFTLKTVDLSKAVDVDEKTIIKLFNYLGRSELGLGKYFKSSKGSDSRFVFDLNTLATPIAVGMIAAGGKDVDFAITKNSEGIARYIPSKAAVVVKSVTTNEQNSDVYDVHFHGDPIRFFLPKTFKVEDIDELADMLRVLVKHRTHKRAVPG